MARLDRELKALTRGHDGRTARHQLHRWVWALSRADVVASWSAAPERGRLALVGFEAVGRADLLEEARDMAAKALVRASEGGIRMHTPRALQSRLRRDRTREALQMLVFDGERFVRGLLVLRASGRPAFERSVRRQMGRIEAAVAEALAEAEKSERMAGPTSRQLVLLSASGRLGESRQGVGGWVSARRERCEFRVMLGLARETGRASGLLDGCRLEMTRMRGPDGDAVVIELHPRQPVRLAPASPLTPRQAEVAELLVHGATYEEIGRHLGVSANTVKSHTSRIYQVFDAACRTDLIHAWRARSAS